MHRCLGIREIVDLICSHLDPFAGVPLTLWPLKYLDRASRAALAALARTCIFFNGPALDVLWRTQGEFIPLLGLLPGDLFSPFASGSVARNRSWHMIRPIMLSDWTRLLIYTPRVKVLSLDDSQEGAAEIIGALGVSCPGGYLFPNLRLFKGPFMTSLSFPIRPFLPPTLKDITIFCGATNDNISLLSTLAMSCGELHSVSISFHSRSEHADAATSLLVCALPQLRTLKICAPSVAAMQHIAMLPGLTWLELVEIPTAFPMLCSSASTMFPQLRHLTLGPIAIDLATEFLATLSCRPFISVRIKLATLATSAATESLFQSFKTACSHESLSSFTLQNSASILPGGAWENYTVTGHALRVFTCFTNMEILSIMSPVGFDLDDATLLQLAVAWPDLAELSLTHNLTNTRPQLTLRSLHAIARHCPYLQTLTLEFNAMNIPLHIGDAPVVQHALSELGVAGSSIAASPPVARYLSRLFPNLADIATIREDEDNEEPEELDEHAREIGFHRLWKQVEEQIPEFVAARNE
ncbi:hypothetical protein DFH06DRAFT_1485949 [Mycena polygramma]|nr:hypothetical protein DFH06DRAFT_1485949 [Mycena polygramma]